MSKKSSKPIWERLSAPKDKGEEWREQKRKEYAKEAGKRFSKPTCGFFGSPGSLAVGTPYKDPDYALKHPRGGAQFHTLGSGRNFKKNVDGALGKIPSINVGDKYIDPGKKRIEYARSLRKKWLDRPGFKPAGSIKYKPPAFQSELDASSEPAEVKKLLKELNARGPKTKKETFEARNFVTSPTKKGSYGSVGTLMPQYADEVKEMWKYKESPYDRPRELRRLEFQAAQEKLGDRPPFRPRVSLKGQTTFSNNIECYGTAGEDEEESKPREKNRHNRLAMEKAKAARERYLRRIAEEEANERPAFKPTNPGKKNIHFDKKQTLSPYPEHLPDPKVETNPFFSSTKVPEGQAPWVPNNHDSTTPQRSVIIGTLSQRKAANSVALSATK